MRFILARHAETAFNADGRMQGDRAHTPLTRMGIRQAEAMGAALAADLGERRDLDILASPTGRTLQTAAIIAEHLGYGFFDIQTDPRLLEIDVGAWAGRRYDDIVAEDGPILCPDRRILSARPPGGEWYPAVAERLRHWLDDLPPDRDILAVSHGITLRILRGILVGGEIHEGVRVAVVVPQGTVLLVQDGREIRLRTGRDTRQAPSI